MATYISYPRETLRVRAVARFLGAERFEQRSDQPADYLVFDQVEMGGVIDAAALAYFRMRSRQRARSVILIPSWRGLPGNDCPPDWLYVVAGGAATEEQDGAAHALLPSLATWSVGRLVATARPAQCALPGGHDADRLRELFL